MHGWIEFEERTVLLRTQISRQPSRSVHLVVRGGLLLLFDWQLRKCTKIFYVSWAISFGHVIQIITYGLIANPLQWTEISARDGSDLAIHLHKKASTTRPWLRIAQLREFFTGKLLPQLRWKPLSTDTCQTQARTCRRFALAWNLCVQTTMH